MGEVVNLRRARKRLERAQAAKQAETNRIAFGRAKSERVLSEAERALAERRLEGHRLEGHRFGDDIAGAPETSGEDPASRS
jgi:hypothetical protein